MIEWVARTFFALRADAPAAVFFALPLASEVKSVGKVAVVGSFAQASLVMLANEMGNTGTLAGRKIVPVGTFGTLSAGVFSVLLTDGAVDFRGPAIGRIRGAQKRHEGQLGSGSSRRT